MATVGHTQHRWAVQAGPLCCCPGAGPTKLHSETVRGAGKKPQLRQLPTKWTQSPISGRTELGYPPNFMGPTPIEREIKKGTQPQTKTKPTQPR